MPSLSLHEKESHFSPIEPPFFFRTRLSPPLPPPPPPRPMSLKCLICRGGHRTNSDLDYRCAQELRCCDKVFSMTVERTWSSPLTPSPYEQVRGALPKSTKGRHHRLHISGPLAFGGSWGVGPAGEPRLVRSWGMRRDWSFEDLAQWRDGKRRDKTVLQ